MRPILADEKAMAEDRGMAAIVGTSDENDCAAGWGLKIEHEIGRHRPACWSAFDTHRCAASDSSNVSFRVIEQLHDGDPFEASPHLRLPPTVKALDGGLKARLARRCEDGHDAEQKTCSDHTPDRIGVLMWSLEDVVVVEL